MTETQMDRRVKSLMDYWPIIALIATGITGYLQLKWTVADIRTDLDSIQDDIQKHREVVNQQEIAEEHRLTSMEKDIQCLTGGGAKGHARNAGN
jgi:hypothetical protein